jgi:WXXGXW repeat (2 copies)
MFKKIILSNVVIILAAVFLLTSIQLSLADYGSFTINVPNAQGGYTAVVIKQSGDGYVGPQGEYYSQFPSVTQLQVVYGLSAPNSTVVDEQSAPQEVVITTAPPALPVYVQPDPPDSDYIWTPGYWGYDSFFQDYYWVPGTWVRPPSTGLLWTPGYWHWREGHFIFSDGYWGIHIGFYGGINYGHGYEGRGFSGGGWRNKVFINKTVNVTNVTNVTNITNNTTINNTSSFNGGPGGTKIQPTPEEQTAVKEKHIPAIAEQKMHVQAARKNPTLRASANHGKPVIAATAKPGEFKGKGVVAAKQAGAFYSDNHTIHTHSLDNLNKTKAVKPNKSAAVSVKGVAVARQGARVVKQGVAQHTQTVRNVPFKPMAQKPIVKKFIVNKPKPKILHTDVVPKPSGDTQDKQRN